MSSSNRCFLTCIQISQKAGQVVWYSYLFHDFPQFVVIHTVKGFGIVNKAEIDVFSGTLLLFWRSKKLLNIPPNGNNIQSCSIKSLLKWNDCFVNFMDSVQFSCSVVSNSLRPHKSQHASPPCSLPTPRIHSDSCPSSQWCHPAISSSVVPFSSCPQSLPASEPFPMSQLFAWGAQSTGVSALASFLPKKYQGWSPSEWIGWISWQSKGLSRIFSNTTVQKHQFFSAQLSL